MAKRKKKKSKNMKKGANPHAKKPQKTRIEPPIGQPVQHTPVASTAPPTQSPKRSLAQRRAKHALDAIQHKDMKDYDKYVSYVSALPANIIMSGLGQAMAMLKSGKKLGHGILYKHMQDWLCNADGNGWRRGPYSSFNDILQAITNVDKTEDDYIRAQAEAMEYLEWLKKFAVAFLKGEDDTAMGGDDAATTD